jgi:ATP-dependent DNA helicase RecG
MPGLTFAELKAHDQSLPRNRLIANVLYYHALFESWGRGIDLIVNECVKAGLPEPEFFEKSGGFCVRIRTDEVTATEKLTNHLSPRQQEILVVLKQHEYLSTKQLQQKLSEAPKERTLRYDLKQLQKQGLVEHKGHGPTSVWYLVKNDS